MRAASFAEEWRNAAHEKGETERLLQRVLRGVRRSAPNRGPLHRASSTRVTPRRAAQLLVLDRGDSGAQCVGWSKDGRSNHDNAFEFDHLQLMDHAGRGPGEEENRSPKDPAHYAPVASARAEVVTVSEGEGGILRKSDRPVLVLRARPPTPTSPRSPLRKPLTRHGQVSQVSWLEAALLTFPGMSPPVAHAEQAFRDRTSGL